MKKTNLKEQAIQKQIKMIKNTIEVIDNISKETDDDVWDMGPIETGYEIYEILEKEMQKIINKLNIDFNLIENGNPIQSIEKAIKLIEKEIL